ncbi:MAG TPA: O-antigen ligase family protein [Phenylobacterium sp.]|nr:O-antigen ligase family protein [Phenylobacterium sp.]
MLAVPLLQLVPLPPMIWRELSPALAVPDLPGAEAWRAVSQTPAETWRAFLFLLPPAAMFLAMLKLPAEDHGVVAKALLAAAVFSVLIAAAQLAQLDGFWRWLQERGDARLPSGVFVNRNHQATLMCLALSLSTAFATVRFGTARSVSALWIGLGSVFLMTGAATLSRAGILLLPLALALTGLLTARAWVSRRNLILAGLLAAAAVVSIGAVVQLRGDRIFERFEQTGMEDDRLRLLPPVLEAAKDTSLLGSGLGSFDQVYRAAEPLELVKPTYFNHAHNEYLELWLEAGVLAVILLAAFGLWFARTAGAALRGPVDPLTTAAVAGVLVIALHSLVDFPLRTPAIAVAFAALLGVLAQRAGERSAAVR